MRATAIVYLFLGSSAWASPGEQGRMPPFAAPATLAIFGPELARVVETAAARMGASHEQAGQIIGRIEELDRDHVRLLATWNGSTLQVEGATERIDELAEALGKRVGALIVSSTDKGATSQKSEPKIDAKAVARAAKQQRAELEKRSAVIAASERAPPTVPTPTAPPPTPTPPPSSLPALEGQPAVQPDYFLLSPPSSPPAAPARPPGGPMRVVLHNIGTPQGCASWATMAAREVLERRLRVQVVASNVCGMLSAIGASSEAGRLGARSVVMANFESLRIFRSDQGYRGVGRLRVSVVRDGEMALSRSFEFSRPLLAADFNRAAYDLTASGFTTIAGELHAVLGGEAR